MEMASEIYGSKVFNDATMKKRLPKETYEAIQYAIAHGKRLDIGIATIVANAMKEWAIENGATHYTHWFQPMTGITAEKHDSFVSPAADGTAIMELSGKELVRGEPDASSFPSGGLRTTFEARGYTAWDPTSYAFVRGDTLCVPTAFISYWGDALDKKTPLLRSMDALNRQALRILHLFGRTDVTRVMPMAGAEQEYFLIDKKLYEKRKDLMYANCTLYGARPPKGQEMEDHFFGSIHPRVAAFMRELDHELWLLGIPAKTEHNEVAPGQHELACVYTKVNQATDQNQLVMDLMKKIAGRHDLVCLLHEKPFAGVNGSGKHNNWSLATDSGENLLTPGDTPSQNELFLLLILAIVEGTDRYQSLFRIASSGASNDNRLGGNEAPPAIMSIYLGDELTAILSAYELGTPYNERVHELMKTGAKILPKIPKDTTDRNRTSPFAFTGNKFEFRMLGSSASIADINTVINTTVAESLRRYADLLDAADDFHSALHRLFSDVVREHKRIIFNGNSYHADWVREAEKRGLLNLKTTPDCLPYCIDSDNIALFCEHHVFTETEIRSRYEVMLDSYCKVKQIEALTMIDMARQQILPAAAAYRQTLCSGYLAGREVMPGTDSAFEKETVRDLATNIDTLYRATKMLENQLFSLPSVDGLQTQANTYRDAINPIMADMRRAADALELICSSEYWPYPTYGALMSLT